MIRSETIAMIREETFKGKTPYTIGKELGLSKNTVKKYAGSDPDQQYKYMQPSKLDPFKPQINELMAAGIFNCKVIMERIAANGYGGKISILKEYVKSVPAGKAAIRSSSI